MLRCFSTRWDPPQCSSSPQCLWSKTLLVIEVFVHVLYLSKKMLFLHALFLFLHSQPNLFFLLIVVSPSVSVFSISIQSFCYLHYTTLQDILQNFRSP